MGKPQRLPKALAKRARKLSTIKQHTARTHTTDEEWDQIMAEINAGIRKVEMRMAIRLLETESEKILQQIQECEETLKRLQDRRGQIIDGQMQNEQNVSFASQTDVIAQNAAPNVQP